MELAKVVGKLEEFAPTSLAGSWDNVGLLIEPMDKKPISRILLTNDLTEPVMQEALQKKADMIISYHPPIFRPMKRFTSKGWKERIAILCMENRIALYSPHTSWDAVKGGINEWLLQPFGPGKSEPCERLEVPGSASYSIDVPNQKTKTVSSGCLDEEYAAIPADIRASVKITKHEAHPSLGVGAGRVSTLNDPISLESAIKSVKSHLKMTHVRLALANGSTLQSPVNRVGVCAGSGGSVLGGVKADLILTGEMSHHEVLDFVHRGVSVILTDHSNSERGFHAHISEKLITMMENKVEITVSEVDKDPLEVV